MGNPNGGQLTFAALDAATKEISLPDILSVQATFLASPSSEADSELVMRPLTESKTQASCAVSYQQDGRPMVEFVFVFGDMEKNNIRGGFSYPASSAHVSAPDTDPNDPRLVNYSKVLDEKMGNVLFIAKHHKFLVDPDDQSCTVYQKHATGESTEESRLSGWGGFADDKPLTLPDLAFLMDAFPPPILSQQPTSWVPTISYNVNFFSKPKNLTLAKMDFQTRVATSGVINCDGMAWDADGNILATSRQMARVWDPQAGK
ncbi:hypothetical protein TrRE_jg5603 [Triparma retinervis]|uniref:Thioesterase family protein n=1 Tax=Triparma retinervis TaxID=2557542 RepID=A0A9W7DQM4_9STRA|nr:hypothetical protein TrRE_jg5603 [Triparma retinervis]